MKNTPRFLISEHQINNMRFKLEDRSQLKKIRQVLRLQSGDAIDLFDGNGVVYHCVLEIVSSELITGRVEDKQYITDKSRFRLTLAQALTKAGKLDDIVRMCTEVGVSQFVFFESEYSVVKAKDYKPAKLERLSKIIEEAARQSERNFVPEIFGITNFKELVANTNIDTRILCATEDVKDLINIDTIKAQILEKQIQNIMLIIGPEGGFSKSELDFAAANNVIIAKMNLPILRTETAGVVAAGYLLI